MKSSQINENEDSWTSDSLNNLNDLPECEEKGDGTLGLRYFLPQILSIEGVWEALSTIWPMQPQMMVIVRMRMVIIANDNHIAIIVITLRMS